ncbi:MAG: hypothetical protein GFGODING_02479 [Flavobacteriales bacterium]|nr:hypothetical protein [Flavobacteriales bacterium]
MERTVAAWAQLGRVFGLLGADAAWPGHACGLSQVEYEAFRGVIDRARHHNGWFTPEEVRHAAAGLAHLLDRAALDRWLAAYPALVQDRQPRTVGLVLAGNVPFVGLHDLLCTTLAGHRARVKVSGQDAGLTRAAADALLILCPDLAPDLAFAGEKLGAVDAVIATGSTNTSRYFEHYFGHLPRIVRKGRVSIAVLDGSESEAELDALGEDVFRYFGLGCRNVSKVFVPTGFDTDRLFKAFYRWKDIARHAKYANNLDYHRALWLLDGEPFLENGFLLLRETGALASPVAVLHLERYTDRQDLEDRSRALAGQVQCIVGHGHVPFGQAQRPGPDDYADGVDTLAFLLGL